MRLTAKQQSVKQAEKRGFNLLSGAIITKYLKAMAYLLLVFSLVILLTWLAGFLIVNDLTVKSTDIYSFGKILLVFPHADDEVLGCAGLIKKANNIGKRVTLVILTKGEKGTPDGTINLKLKETRTREAQLVAKYLGIKKLIQEDFGDGELIKKKTQLRQYISKLFAIEKPDLVITYDEPGLYGHSDHIAVSAIVTDLINSKYREIKLWYTTYPKRVISMISLPEDMAKDPNFKQKRKEPNLKIFTLAHLLFKIRSVYIYKSQYHSFRSGIPVPLIPLWFFYSTSWFEYYYEA